MQIDPVPPRFMRKASRRRVRPDPAFTARKVNLPCVSQKRGPPRERILAKRDLLKRTDKEKLPHLALGYHFAPQIAQGMKQWVLRAVRDQIKPGMRDDGNQSPHLTRAEQTGGLDGFSLIGRFVGKGSGPLHA